MEKQQIWILALTIVVLIVVMVVAAYFSQNSDRGGIDPAKRFVARPGTTREKAAILTSSKKPASSDDTKAEANVPQKAETPDKPAASLPVKSLSKEGEERSDTEKLVQDAVNQDTPEAGIAQLQQALSPDMPPEEQAAIRTAMGRLMAQQNPPAADAALAEFDQAMALIPKLEDRLKVFREELDILLTKGADDLALSRIQALIAESEPQSAPRTSLALMLGQTYENVNAAKKAEETYRQAWSEAMQENSTVPKECEDTLRLIALRLARLYRATGRDKEAGALAEQLTAWKERNQ